MKKPNPVKQMISCHSTIMANLLKVGVCVPVLLLAACNSGSENHGLLVSDTTQTNPNKQVGLLLPLSGRNGNLGNNMLKAAQLALSDPSAPPLNIYDTEQVGGAAEAARRAVAAKDGIILGPLTARQTSEVASVTTSSNIPVIAYTSDVAASGPNVWAFGITPEQQVLTMVRAAKNQGKTKFAALLPDNPMGRAMAGGLTKACADLGLMQPTIVYHSADSNDIVQKLKALSNYDARLQDAKNNPEAISKADNTATTAQENTNDDNLLDELAPSGNTAKKSSQKLVLGAPPFDALVLADTGLQLQSVINALGETQIASPQVQIMGPGLWGAFASKLGKLQGAWYAAPNPTKRQGFVRQYTAKYGQAPKPLADLTYDTAALANSLSKVGGYTSSNLTRADGFDGVDGLFVLKPDGHVQRDLQIFQIQPTGGGKMITTPSTVMSTGTKTNS
ncbi:penicillin-binding protein activator [Commensalibacter oyaizuii]|uniref:Penicillin-binding protein activator n=1 Tax=Commensalibacter oyaizuii TaxID=3043873 RepID=A0ABT6Q2C0_9PROT|nr:penicillin-binding protein activator [Commensalibacter sp. TBRC 16381]MDI2091261.1 penicillin-binding protein activator [Commensalibacter sp. TBRC 16381]